MPKYLILPGCDDTNRGDQALIWETVELAKEAGYNGEFYMLADADKAIQSEQRNINHIEYILPHPSTHFKSSDNINYTVALKIKWALAAVWDLISRVPLLYPKLRKLMFPLYSESVKESLRIFEMSAVSFVKGGGFLHAYGGIAESYKIYYFLYHIRLALSYGQEIYIMPNSFGPFEGKIVKHMIKKTLAKCKVVMSRESVSREKLESVCSITSELHSDLAFSFQQIMHLEQRGCLKKREFQLERKLV